jgi:hypothetical protein
MTAPVSIVIEWSRLTMLSAVWRFSMAAIRILGAICAVTVICAGTTSARGETFKVGRLLCLGGARVGQVVGSTQSLRCVFRRRNSSQRYVYDGKIRRIGLDVGVIRAGTLSWTVFARNSPRLGPGRLTGRYVGASASIALGPGFGANVLIGGSRRSIVLQPLSIERSMGINLAAGQSTLTLSARGTAANLQSHDLE